jgi:hypothetical protein
MNERVRELAVQAHAKGNTLHYYNPEFIEKFAELIVKECADIASINQFQYDAVGNYVLKHFGINK